MDANKLSSMEIDAIGEILNISLGASATAISTMLDTRVDITTPIVQVRTKQEFEFTNLEPAIGVEITYNDGLSGSNIMVLKKNDVRIIVGMLMGAEIPVEDFVLDEMNISAICEVMNQMMGASATALSELLGMTVNISTPISFEIENPESFKDKYFTKENQMVVIGFTLRIADKVESEFMNLMPLELASDLVSGFFSDGVPELDVEPVKKQAEEPKHKKAEPDPVVDGKHQEASHTDQAKHPSQYERPMQGSVPTYQGMPSQGNIPYAGMDVNPAAYQNGAPQLANGVPDMQMMNSMTQMMDLMRQQLEMQQAQMKQLQAGPRKIKVDPVPRANLNGTEQDAELQESNLELIMGVPLEVSVEIGRTKKLVKDILDLNKGSLVVLDKLAGEQVDLFVNGQCIAQGDVVVVEDNFGIRITEILADEIPLEE